MTKSRLSALATLVVSVLIYAAVVHAQNSPQAGTNPVQSTQSLYYTTPISSTAAVNNQVTLTIPAPAAGLYNYVCTLDFHASQDGTATAQTNAVTTSTNFNSFAIKYSLTATATINYDKAFVWGTPATGCAKSAASGTATTFVSPAAGANIAFTWTSTYFVAP